MECSPHRNWDGYSDGFAQQGWQCPVCKRVYSPTTPMCLYCGHGTITSTTSDPARENTVNALLVEDLNPMKIQWEHVDSCTCSSETRTK